MTPCPLPPPPFGRALPSRNAVITGLCLAALPIVCLAQHDTTAAPDVDSCQVARRDGNQARTALRIDNDYFAGRDGGYTSGLVLAVMSPTFSSRDPAPCLPPIARSVSDGLGWLLPSGVDRRQMTFSVGHAMLTPTDGQSRDIVRDDRPYAGVLVASVGFHGIQDDTLQSTFLRLGWVGPSARGAEFQRAVHRVTGSERFNGWDHQLHDEPVFQVHREWTGRGPHARVSPKAGANGWDTFWHGGASLGTLATGAVAGVQLRYGRGLTGDFGSQATWAAGDGAVPERSPLDIGGWSWHAVLGTDVRWVIRNITLDGNTFHDSHRVKKRKIVGEVNYGVVAQRGTWRVSLSRYHRSREFETQQSASAFGSVTVTHRWDF